MTGLRLVASLRIEDCGEGAWEFDIVVNPDLFPAERQRASDMAMRLLRSALGHRCARITGMEGAL